MLMLMIITSLAACTKPKSQEGQKTESFTEKAEQHTRDSLAGCMGILVCHHFWTCLHRNFMASMQEEMGSYSIIIQKILPTRNYHLIADNIFYRDWHTRWIRQIYTPHHHL